MAATVVPALRAFGDELTGVAPRRTLPDWYLGDSLHRLSASGHNPDDTPGSKSEDTDSDTKADIRAGDYRLPLNATFTPEELIQFLVKECRAGRITWMKYIIFNKRIWSASSDWVTQRYTGSNPHDKHFHISCKPQTAHENNTKPVGLSALLPSIGDDEMDQGEFNTLLLNALKNQNIAAQFRAFPWSYTGRGIGDNDLTPEGNISTLSVFDMIHDNTRAILAALAQAENVDTNALAEAMAPAVARALVPLLPEDRDDVTVDELTEAFRRAVLGPTMEINAPADNTR